MIFAEAGVLEDALESLAAVAAASEDDLLEYSLDRQAAAKLAAFLDQKQQN